MSLIHLSTDSLEGYLRDSMSQNKSSMKKAEETLMLLREDPQYLVTLLEVILTTKDHPTQLVAAIELKNTTHLHWVRKANSSMSKKQQVTILLTERVSREFYLPSCVPQN
jgi:hypothetical protein